MFRQFISLLSTKVRGFARPRCTVPLIVQWLAIVSLVAVAALVAAAVWWPVPLVHVARLHPALSVRRGRPVRVF